MRLWLRAKCFVTGHRWTHERMRQHNASFRVAGLRCLRCSARREIPGVRLG